MARITKRELLEEAEKKLTEAYNLLRVHEKVWQDEWDAAANPFVAWEGYKKQQPQRQTLVRAWLDAKNTHNNLTD